MKFNINQEVKVRLTPEGRAEMPFAVVIEIPDMASK